MEPLKIENLKEEIRLLKESLAQKDLEIEELRTGHLFLETLFDGINEEVMVIDPEYTIKDVNKMFLENYHLAKDDVLGKACYEIKYQLDGPCGPGRQPCPLEKAKTTGHRIEVPYTQELEGGKSRHMVKILYPLGPIGGAPEYFVEISRDVTEFQNLLRRLKSSEKKFRTILDTATDAILSIDTDHRILLYNNAAEEIFGYSRREALGKNLNLLIPPQYGDHYRFVSRFLETRTPKVMGRSQILTALRKNGEEFPIELGLSYHEIEGKITFTAIIRDLSEQKLLERKLLQTERLAAVGQTVAHVAHEIKNPLMIIGGFSHQIKNSLTDEKAVQKLDMIFDEIARLERLVANLVDFTKVYKLVKRPADINSVIRDVLRIMAEIYPSDKYVFETDFSTDIGDISCDPDKLKQVFMNIIANGVEAMEDGGTITISTEKNLQGLEIRISDQGAGINDEDLLRIFEPFYTTRERGSGLGLSVSYRIAQAHNGEISALSTPGKGTTFVISLPAT